MYVKTLGAQVRIHRARQVVTRIAALQEDCLHPGSEEACPLAEVSALAGEAAGLARSALDDLAVSLVIASRRTPRNTSFPIARSAHDFAEEQHRCLRRANARARDAVRSVTPWKGGDDRLWELRQLAEASGTGPVIHVGQVPTPAVRVPTALQVLQASTPPERVGQPVLLFAEGDLVRGRAVVPALELLVTHAESVVDRVVRATGSS